MLLKPSSSDGGGDFSDHASTAATAMIAAGAGPSSTMASAVEMNAGPIWTLARLHREELAGDGEDEERGEQIERPPVARVRGEHRRGDGRHEQHGFAGDQDRSPARS